MCENAVADGYDRLMILRGDRMKRFVEGADRGQSTLLPECLDDWIDENNPASTIRVGSPDPGSSSHASSNASFISVIKAESYANAIGDTPIFAFNIRPLN